MELPTIEFAIATPVISTDLPIAIIIDDVTANRIFNRGLHSFLRGYYFIKGEAGLWKGKDGGVERVIKMRGSRHEQADGLYALEVHVVRALGSS